MDQDHLGAAVMSRLENLALRAARDLRVAKLDQAGNVVNHRGIEAVSPPRAAAVLDPNGVELVPVQQSGMRISMDILFKRMA